MPRMLAVDDDPLVLKTLELILVSAGFQVLTAKNGPAAIRIVQSVQGDIDLMVSDIEMPEMDGKAFSGDNGNQLPGNTDPIYFRELPCRALLRRSTVSLSIKAVYPRRLVRVDFPPPLRRVDATG